MNLFMADPTISKLSSMHFYGWRLGLKTGCYYLRSQAASRAQAFTVDPRVMSELRLSVGDSVASGAQTPKSVKNDSGADEGCLMCSA
jgi:ribonucleotide reductase alpha subunit